MVSFFAGKDTSDDKKRNNKEVSKGSKDGGKNKTTPKSTTPKSASVKKNSKVTTPKMVTPKSTPKSSSTSKISPKTHKNNASLPIENRKRKGEGETPHSAKRTKRGKSGEQVAGKPLISMGYVLSGRGGCLLLLLLLFLLVLLVLFFFLYSFLFFSFLFFSSLQLWVTDSFLCGKLASESPHLPLLTTAIQNVFDILCFYLFSTERFENSIFEIAKRFKKVALTLTFQIPWPEG